MEKTINGRRYELVCVADPTTGEAVSPGGGAGGGGTSNTTEATQLAVKAAVESINTKTPALQNGATPVTAVIRSCIGRQTLAIAAGTVVTLTVPGGAFAAQIQADGGTVRITQDGTTNPTAAIGTRIDDGVIYPVDTTLANVKLFASTACSAQICYFDRA